MVGPLVYSGGDEVGGLVFVMGERDGEASICVFVMVGFGCDEMFEIIAGGGSDAEITAWVFVFFRICGDDGFNALIFAEDFMDTDSGRGGDG